VPIGELAGSDHDGVLAPIAVESQQLAQALDHREVRLLPSVVGRCPVPAHAGQLARQRLHLDHGRDGIDQAPWAAGQYHRSRGAHAQSGMGVLNLPKRHGERRADALSRTMRDALGPFFLAPFEGPALGGDVSGDSSVAILATLIALPITSVGRLSPLGPLGGDRPVNKPTGFLLPMTTRNSRTSAGLIPCSLRGDGR